MNGNVAVCKEISPLAFWLSQRDFNFIINPDAAINGEGLENVPVKRLKPGKVRVLRIRGFNAGTRRSPERIPILRYRLSVLKGMDRVVAE